jgi:hypothetical protein
MLKKSSSFVLTRHSRLTISTAFTNVPRLIRRGVNLRGSTYGPKYASPLPSPAALPAERRISARRGWTGEIVGLFEHPAGIRTRTKTGHS